MLLLLLRSHCIELLWDGAEYDPEHNVCQCYTHQCIVKVCTVNADV